MSQMLDRAKVPAMKQARRQAVADAASMPKLLQQPEPITEVQNASLSEASDWRTLLRLMTWLSPSYPVGAFAYSSGIEWAIEAGDIRDAATLAEWLRGFLSHGAGRNDAILMAQAYRAVRGADNTRLRDIAELANALASSRERHLETTAQGRAFLDVTRAAWGCAALENLVTQWNGPVAYPVAVGVACAGHDVALAPALLAFVHAQTANWISAGVRLIPLGQTDSQHVLAQLEENISTAAQAAFDAPLDDLGSATFRADIGAMHHETQYTRLFRS